MPLYQTDDDWERQKKVGELLERAWRLRVRWYGKNEYIDGYASDAKEMQRLLEIKTHPYDVARYPTTIIGVAKTIILLERARQMVLDPYVVVQFTDGLYEFDARFIDLRNHDIIHRDDRPNVYQDESVFRFPCKELTRVRGPRLAVVRNN